MSIAAAKLVNKTLINESRLGLVSVCLFIITEDGMYVYVCICLPGVAMMAGPGC